MPTASSNAFEEFAGLSERRRTWWIAAILAVTTLVAFAPALWNDFVDWDDSVNVVTNKQFRGLSLANLRWMSTTLLMGHWIPVTWLTFGFDYVLWGMNPVGYHLTNVALHAADVAVLYFLALALIGRATIWPAGPRHFSAVVAALFYGLHPLRVESVAWVTERRDVLSTLFFLLTVLAYLRAADEGPRSRRWHALALSIFALGIASKSMVMTLPAILVILDIYPLRRIRLERAAWPRTKTILREKLPYAALGIAGAAIGFYAQHANYFFSSLDRYPWPARIAISCYSLCFYLVKTVLPTALGPVYELPYQVHFLELRFVGPAVVVVVITGISLAARRRYPAVPAAWASYVVLLSPVVGLAHSGFQIAHDRYSYLPALGLSLLVAAGAGLLVARIGQVRPLFRVVGVGALATWLAALAFLSWHQTQMWRNTEALWTYAVDVEPDCAVCHSNLGAFLINRNQPEAALEHIMRALALRPDNPRTHANLAIALLRFDNTAAALQRLEVAVAVHPRNRDLLTALGLALVRSGRYAEAFEPLDRALVLSPNSSDAGAAKGVALAHLGRRDEALVVLRRAVTLDNESPQARYAYAWALAHFGDVPAARSQQAYLHHLDPKLAVGLSREISSMN